MSVSKLLRLVFFHRLQARLLILLVSLLATIIGLAGPYFQKLFIDDLMSPQWTLQTSAFHVMAGFFCLFLSLALNGLTNFLGMNEAVIMQGILAKKLYEKVLLLKIDSLKGRSVGEFVSVYATDIPHATVFLEQSLPVGANILFPLIIAPIALIYLFHLPWALVFTVLFLLFILNVFMAYRQSVYFFRFKKLAADRIALVNEWIQNIRSLKILGWIDSFEEKIFKIRRIETGNRITMVTNGQSMNSISSSATFFLNIGSLYLIIYNQGDQVSAGTLMACLWVIGVFMTRPLRQLPWFFTFVFDSWTSLTRISQFLSIENSKSYFLGTSKNQLVPVGTEDLAIDVESLNLVIEDHLILKDINLQIKKGWFVCIVAEVGSGKTLLLLPLLGETGAKFQKYLIGKNDCRLISLQQLKQFFSFVPQEGFIMSSNLRDNVAFRYDTTLQQDLKINSALNFAQFDIIDEKMPRGLDTEIGERGVNLSGGQKQRVSIARVDFLKAPIIMLDDCFSALDVGTEEKLLQQLKLWKNETILLSTHRLSVLKNADHIVFLKNGKVHLQGTLSQLRKEKDFKEFIKQTELKETETT